MGETLLFRKGTKEEIPEIYELFLRGIEEMTANGIPQWDEVYPTKRDLELDIEMDELYVGVSGKEIAVVYVLNKECDEQYSGGKWTLDTDDFMVIHRLCVHPKFQNKGLGRQTLMHIENTLKQEGISSIRLDAFTRNPYALKMYDSFGYAVVGEANWRKGKFFLMEKVIS